MMLPTDFSRTHHHSRSVQVLAAIPLPTHDPDTILASYLTLLHHYTGTPHLQVGMQGWHTEAEQPCAITVDLTPDTTRSDLLQKIQPTAGDSLPVRFSLADSKVAVQDDPDTELCLTVKLEAGMPYLEVAYDSALFSEATIQRMSDNLLTLLQAIMDHPDQPLVSLPFLSETERQLIESYNRTDVPYPHRHTIQQAFSEQVQRTPDQIAVQADGQCLTYRQLHKRSNQLAHSLRARGCGRGTLIAILTDRSPEMLVSILGIIKSGAAYLPIDPDAPQARLTYMLEDSQAKLVLTQSHLRELVPPNVPLMVWEECESDLETYPSDEPELINNPDDLAYIIYTSGSTGQPKGTLLSHRGVVNLGTAQRSELFIHEQSRVLQFASFSFDASVLEIFTVLLCGATLVLAKKEVTRDPNLLADLMRRERITFTLLGPALLQQLPPEIGPDLETLVSGGEACPSYLAEQWAGRVNLVNAYGPTESTVVATAWVSKTAGGVPNPLPIGKPLPNTKIYILNEHLQQMPIGVGGEIYIGGPGVALGYLNRPDLTAARFVENPFAKGERIYRSGDVGRLLPDGNIEFLGRADKQVKLRGFRIELGEIEAVLAEHPSVKECVVILDESRHFKRLLGYAVPNGEFPAAEVRAHVAERMPDYMVPAHILQVPAIPLTISGKVDHKMLPVPEELEVDEGYIEPETVRQSFIAEIWQDALGVKRVGLHDNFFDLGGDSLVIFPIVMRMKERFPGVSVQDVYKYPTVHELDRYLAEKMEPQIERSETGWQIVETLHALDAEQEKAEPPQTVLLTGATGYLGAYLLRELMNETDAHIYCLVRPRNGSSAWARLAENMRFYFGDAILAEMEQRVTAVAGDLGEPALGLQKGDRDKLRNEVDLILHSGADVRHYGDAEWIEKVNVQGTEELLALAKGREGVRFHLISTLSVIDGPDDNVYVRSKRATEKLVHRAIREGVQPTIFRAGNLVGHSETGLFQRNLESNAFYRMLKGMMLLGVTHGEQREVDLTPVDYAARAIIEYGLRSGMAGRTLPICNPKTTRMGLMVQDLREMGYAIRAMEVADYREWIMELNRTGQQQEAVQLVLADLMEAGEGAEGETLSLGGSGACELLEKAGVRCPEPDRVLVRRLVEYAVEAGYFPAAGMTAVK